MLTGEMKRLFLRRSNTQLRSYLQVCCGLSNPMFVDGCKFATSVLVGRYKRNEHKHMLACIEDGGISLTDADIAAFRAAWEACAKEPINSDEQPAYVIAERMVEMEWTFTQDGWGCTLF